MAATMSFVNLTEVISVAMEQWSAQHSVIMVETFFLKMATLLLKRSEHFASQKCFFPQYHTVIGRKLENECFRIKNETTRRCVNISITIEHRGCKA
jgi:hypothetical protein